MKKILLWLFFLPVMLSILIYRKVPSRPLAWALIGGFWIAFFSVAINLPQENSPVAQNTTEGLEPTTKQASAPKTEKADKKEEEKLTGPQKNAIRSAKSYLDLQGFSRKGLIDQLSSEYGDGYSVADATVAVDSLNIDWNAQAARAAKSYLDLQGFSCQGLIDQLSSEYGDGYSVEQATYGAQQTDACDQQ